MGIRPQILFSESTLVTNQWLNNYYLRSIKYDNEFEKYTRSLELRMFSRISSQLSTPYKYFSHR